MDRYRTGQVRVGWGSQEELGWDRRGRGREEEGERILRVYKGRGRQRGWDGRYR